MCSVVILRRPGHPWPLLIAANRDEMTGRSWRPPARHWPDRPEVVAGLDESAGGSWLGLNDTGVAAAILNREGSLGRQPGKRSRGELVLEALDHADAADAADALGYVDPAAYRPFNMVVADNRDAFFVAHRGTGPLPRIAVEAIPEGLSMVTAHNLNDAEASPRIRFYRPLFQAAAVPDPDTGDWQAWEQLLADRMGDGSAGAQGGMCIVTDTGFGTSSSALIALPSAERTGVPPVFRFCPGRPDQVRWQAVDLL
jgi:hypothetical protein